jgi:3-isopropylmalate/(R)-2-methylmalate dehydratase small subunit
LGIAAIVAESYGAIYKRNAINSGLPLVACPGLHCYAEALSSAQTVLIDLETGEFAVDAGPTIQADPFSQVQMAIYQAGDLFAYGKLLQVRAAEAIDG